MSQQVNGAGITEVPAAAPINAMEVLRDENGFWYHPGIPDFDEDAEAYRAWLKAQGLETKCACLEAEDDEHPVYQSYFEGEDSDISAWSPPAPEGDGWFTLSIHDTEDGPVWVWARRTAITAGELV